MFAGDLGLEMSCESTAGPYKEFSEGESSSCGARRSAGCSPPSRSCMLCSLEVTNTIYSAGITNASRVHTYVISEAIH